MVRAFPVTSLTKEKRISVQYLGHLDQWLQEGLQLRSNTFQLLKVAFDEEVNLDSVESLRKLIHRVRHPPSVLHYFAFVGQTLVDAAPIHKGSKEKSATLKGIAKKTLLKTARHVGLKPPKSAAKRQKYILQPPGSGLPSVRSSMSGSGSLLREREDDELSMEESGGRNPSAGNGLNGAQMGQQPFLHQADPKTLERVMERSYCKDFQRLNLAASPNSSGTLTQGGKVKGDSFRISTANSQYNLCRTYPALLVVPTHLSDDSLRRVARCYRHGRLPVVTWRHPRTKGY